MKRTDLPATRSASHADTTSRQQVRSKLESHLLRPALSLGECRAREQHVMDEVLSKSTSIDQSNFKVVSQQDLVRMAEAYDRHFFEGTCLRLARMDGLRFRWSKRMTSAGGKTTRFHRPAGPRTPASTHYEIALSSTLLFQTFRDESTEALVCGRQCFNRLQAMQRIVEHELIHLAEMLVWEHSNCAARRFQSIAHRLFAHTEHRHELITPQERARTEFNIRVGCRVAFRFEGTPLTGLVNRITRRATVLVEDPRGTLYSNGHRYVKYYMPLSLLKRIDQ
jgi:hypothetical protein